jgi:HEAT repeat protein
VERYEVELVRASFSPSAESAAELVAALSAPLARHRVLALRGLVRRALMTDGRWRAALEDQNADVRRDALEQLAHAPSLSDELVDRVVATLADDDDLVVDAAAFALGEHHVGAAVTPLCRVATDHEDARCRESAIAALGAIGDDRARATIIHALDDKPPVRRRAIVALANFDGPDIDAALERASEDRDWQVRSAVAQLRDDED